MIRVEIEPRMLRWARERAGFSADALAGRFPRLAEWEKGKVRPTLKQLEEFARATYAPLGFLLLDQPPAESLPLRDFRTSRAGRAGPPSPNLLEMIYVCQQRQEWYRDFARSEGEARLDFVGSASLTDDIPAVAGRIRDRLRFDLDEQRRSPTWTDALRRFIEHAEGAGVLVMCSGVVLNNNRRRLDPDEFRGFAISDEFAPLVFINGADTKAGQMFTLAHELAHVWLGESGVTDAVAGQVPDHRVERWCNRVAAELLVPLSALRAEFDLAAELWGEVSRLARRFKVSTLVVLRRIHDVGGLAKEEFWAAYAEEAGRLRALRGGGGGDFYLTEAARVSRRFARALVVSTLEGRTLHRDALRILGLSKLETFRELGRMLEVHT